MHMVNLIDGVYLSDGKDIGTKRIQNVFVVSARDLGASLISCPACHTGDEDLPIHKLIWPVRVSMQRPRGGKGHRPPDTRPRPRSADSQLHLVAAAPPASSARPSLEDCQGSRLGLIRDGFLRNGRSSSLSIAASMSNPKRVGAVTIPPFFPILSTRSMIRQSVLPGECRRPRPIYLARS